MLTTSILLSVHGFVFAAEPQFYPGEGDDMAPVPASATLTGTILARVADPATLATRDDVARVVVLGGDGHVVRVEPAPGQSVVELANRLHGVPGVTWSHPDFRVTWVSHALPNDPYLDRQWHLLNDGQRGYIPGVDLNAEEAWDVTDGTGTLVAVVDSGVDIDHPDLRVIDGPDFIDGDKSSDPQDGSNHGTAVAGLIAAKGDNGIGTAGVAHGGEVYGLRLINGTSTIEATYDTFVDAVDAGADVINNSWGIEGCDAFPRVRAIEDAYDYAEESGRGGAGTVIVFSAGNDACDVTGDGLVQHPAVIAVAAVSGRDVRENYSNFGPWVDITAPSGRIVTTDLVGAPGGGSIDGDPDYTQDFGGTSASAPQVAGVAALMIAANPRIHAAEIRSVLCDTAVRNDPTSPTWDETGWSPLYGCGRVDAGAAVRAVANEGPPGIPELPTTAQTTPERVMLAWAPPEDPDGDTLAYRVRWIHPSDPGNERSVLVDRPWLDLTELVSRGEVQWRVRAVDLWGPGEWSQTQVLTVALPPEPEPVVEEPSRTCGLLPAGGSWLWWGAAAWLARRRRE